MKESLFDVLMYLFENYMEDDSPLFSDPERLKLQLSDAGFRHSQINKAFVWLEDLAQGQEQELHPLSTTASSIRVFHPEECRKLNVECRGFLTSMQQLGVIDTASRELIIDRVMALESEEIDLEQLKWVVLMVLFNQPGLEAAYSWVENLVLDDISAELH
ncbi:MAG: DUF494 domain-containing protein [Gammaproteobacteria bacterium]|nr:DUF494 domain-containing protein [Gammaproteobacteria bacterium]MDH5802019.1 DUF494 domain-containing protein [Gammaproteobacteria bacterium]